MSHATNGHLSSRDDVLAVETCLRIRDWEQHFENNRTRDLKSMAWVPVPTKQDGDGYTELLDHANGAAQYGAWIGIVCIGAKSHPRGTLLRDGCGDGPQPHDAASLSRISRIPARVFEEAIPRLLAIGWLERIPLPTQAVAKFPQEGAAQPQEGAPSRTRARARAGTEWKGTEWNKKEGQPPSEVCTDAAAAAVSVPAPVVMVFPTEGKQKSWALTTAKCDEYADTYPHLDVRAELRKALQWLRDNPAKRKTPGGMPGFLTRWLNRAQDGDGRRRDFEYPPQSRTPIDASAFDLEDE